jgi:archaellum biogenesis protein FlaJ (TadC family)
MDFLFSHTRFFEYLGLLSLATFVISLLLIPFLISRAPADYFLIHAGHKEGEKCGRTMGCLILTILRNSLGAFLLVAGITMLFLPGQGILTILLSLTLLDFPGKKRLLAQAITKHSVQHGLNWIRKKAHKEPFFFAEDLNRP